MSKKHKKITHFNIFEHMKRKFFYLAAAAIVSFIVLFACNKNNYVFVENVVLSSSAVSLNVGEQIQLTAIVEPADADDPSVTWTSSNPSVAEVDNNGVVRGIASGPATVTVTTVDGEKTATCAVTVNLPGIELSKPTLRLDIVTNAIGEQLMATITPAAANQQVTWSSSNPLVATVTNTPGLVAMITAISPGTTTITVTTVDGGKTATCVVTVPDVAVSGVMLNEATLSLLKNETATLIATVLPANATTKTVTWSTNAPAVASVNATGVVTALGDGEATITATTQDGNKTASCIVTVTVPVTSITLNTGALALKVGETATLTPNILPSDASNKTVNWTSGNTAVATVDNAGLVTATGPGSTTITASTQDGGKMAVCNVTVTPLHTPVTSVSLTPATLILNGSDTGTLTATVLPVDATEPSVTWSTSNDTIATVSSDGVITPVPPTVPYTGARTVPITATSVDDTTKKATCTVTINYVPVTGITFDPATLSLEIDDIETPTPTVAPDNASIKTVRWEIGGTPPPTGIIGLSASGRIVALGAGTAPVIAISVAHPTVSGTCTVTVNP